MKQSSVATSHDGHGGSGRGDSRCKLYGADDDPVTGIEAVRDSVLVLQ